MEDIVFVRKVAIMAHIGLDCWQRDKQQPALLSFKVWTSIEEAGKTDHIKDTIDYRSIYKFLTAFDGGKFTRVGDILDEMWTWGAKNQKRVDCIVELPKALLHSEGVRIEHISFSEAEDAETTLYIQDLKIPCIIGIGAHERIHKQPVIVNIELEGDDRSKWMNLKIDNKEELLRNIPKYLGGIYERFETSNFQTLEAFVSALARYCIAELQYSGVTVSAYKPSVFAAAEGPGVEIYRTKDSFPDSVDYPDQPNDSLEGIH